MVRFTLACLLVAIVASPTYADDDTILLRTGYMANTMAGAHQITVRGTLGGEVRLELDPNACAIDAYGDPTVCTRIASRLVKGRLAALEQKDPSGLGRSIYLVETEKPAWRGALSLVVPGSGGGAYRLVWAGEDGGRFVHPLEAFPEAPASTNLGRATYTAWQNGGVVSIKAAGENPTTGYRTHFEQLPIMIWPPQHRLVAIPPEGMAGQAITPFEVTVTFKATEPVKTVIVHDADGKHEVPVKPPK